MANGKTKNYDVIVKDCRLPDRNGLGSLNWLRASGVCVPSVLVTGTMGDEFVGECIKARADDYVPMENLGLVSVAVRRAREEPELRVARGRVEKQPPESEKQYRLLLMRIRARKTLRFLTVNEVAIRRYGYCLNEFLLRTEHDIRPEEDQKHFVPFVGIQLSSCRGEKREPGNASGGSNRHISTCHTVAP